MDRSWTTRRELVERATTPNAFHREFQRAILQSFSPWPGRGVFANPEIRLRLDLPLATFEIVSPDDRFADLRAKLDDDEQAGVPHIVVVDAAVQKVSVCRRRPSSRSRDRIVFSDFRSCEGDLFRRLAF